MLTIKSWAVREADGSAGQALLEDRGPYLPGCKPPTTETFTDLRVYG